MEKEPSIMHGEKSKINSTKNTVTGSRSEINDTPKKANAEVSNIKLIKIKEIYLKCPVTLLDR